MEILPVDSEHSALFQLVAAAVTGRGRLGGRSRRPAVRSGAGRRRLGEVTQEQALAHPTWSMGEKITIDSATLMNKGLEVIEAHHLFGLPYERIEVVVHPQSLVHALVRLVDGALLAHLGRGRHARAHRVRAALSRAGAGGRRGARSGVGSLPRLRGSRRGDLPGDPPGARGRAARGDRRTCALNAANEVAVRAFLEGRIGLSGYSRGGGGGRRARARAEPSERTKRSSPSINEARRRPKVVVPSIGTKGEIGEQFRRVIVAIVGLGFLILAHEFGHFIVAEGHRHARGGVQHRLRPVPRQQARSARRSTASPCCRSAATCGSPACTRRSSTPGWPRPGRRRPSEQAEQDQPGKKRRRPQDPEDRLAGPRALTADEIAATPARAPVLLRIRSGTSSSSSSPA